MKTRLIVEVAIPDEALMAEQDLTGFQMIRNVLQLVAIRSGCGFDGGFTAEQLDAMDPPPGCPRSYAYEKHYDVYYWWEHTRGDQWVPGAQ